MNNCSLHEKTKYLLERVLHDLIVGDRLRFPAPVEGAKISKRELEESWPWMRIAINDSLVRDASITKNIGVKLTAGWLCGRWCSSYFLLHSILKPKLEEPLLEVLPADDGPFKWPASVPDPGVPNNQIVEWVNKAYPCIFLSTVLHEIGHAKYAEEKWSGQDLEIACDDFAISYLLGKSKPLSLKYRTIGIAIWLCCLCSESLDSRGFVFQKHPHPVVRLQNFLNNHVPNQGDFGAVIWLMCVNHVAYLARIHKRPDFENEVYPSPGADLKEMLENLRLCW